MENKYQSIINLPHMQSKKRAHMSVYDRAAQFAPFAALTGYEEAVKETARLTDEKRILSESEAQELNSRLNFISEHILQQPKVTISFFKADDKKSGGAYLSVTGAVKKIENFERLIIMKSGEKIPTDDIESITGEIFNFADND